MICRWRNLQSRVVTGCSEKMESRKVTKTLEDQWVVERRVREIYDYFYSISPNSPSDLLALNLFQFLGFLFLYSSTYFCVDFFLSFFLSVIKHRDRTWQTLRLSKPRSQKTWSVVFRFGCQVSSLYLWSFLTTSSLVMLKIPILTGG